MEAKAAVVVDVEEVAVVVVAASQDQIVSALVAALEQTRKRLLTKLSLKMYQDLLYFLKPTTNVTFELFHSSMNCSNVSIYVLFGCKYK